MIAEWEQAPPEQREPWSYYDRWLDVLDRVLAESGIVPGNELDQLRAALGR